jgi:probable phosphoglycerate mutase
MRLIITRHGETEENVSGIIQGHLPGKLTKKGIKQAKKLADRLKKEQIDFIYSSDLARCVDTTKEIIKYHSGVPVTYVEGLREIYLGKWEGKTKEELGFPPDKSLGSKVPDDGETPKELYNRAKNFLKEVLTEHSNNTVLFVGYKKINNALIAIITNKSIDEMFSMKYQNNAGISVFEIGKDRW